MVSYRFTPLSLQPEYLGKYCVTDAERYDLFLSGLKQYLEYSTSKTIAKMSPKSYQQANIFIPITFSTQTFM